MNQAEINYNLQESQETQGEVQNVNFSIKGTPVIVLGRCVCLLKLSQDYVCIRRTG